jgi:RimJ/RimL family protein N-acetyltransferase
MPLEGEIVTLREERPEDMAPLTALRNDLDTQAWSITLPPDYTELMLHKRHEAREFSFDRDDGRFIIVHKETGEVAGYVGYSGLEPRFSAMIGIMVSKPFWGTGVALDTQETLLRFLFLELGLRVVRLWTHSGNPRAIGLAEKSGFKVSLRQRESIFKNGQRYDNIGMDLLREEYFERHPELVDNLPPI